MTTALPVSFRRRVFSPDDQQAFANLSGDYNPLHMDSVAARRTQAGEIVVHGAHTLLYMLDTIAPHLEGRELALVKVRFEEAVYLGEEVEPVLLALDASGFRAEARVADVVVVRISGAFGAISPAPTLDDIPDLPIERRPAEPSLEEMATVEGRVAFASPPEAYADAFPNISGLWDARRTAAIGASTYVVGMVCPGLHSLLGGLTLHVCEPVSSNFAFRAIMAHPEFRLVKHSVVGGGLAGTVESFARHAPTRQANMATIACQVEPDEFAGATALVVGGSRGLGEVVAKLLAAGGASVTITYATGAADAWRVKQEIEDAGGVCGVMRFNVLEDAGAQLGDAVEFDTVYYFATPPVVRRTTKAYMAHRFSALAQYYIDGFHSLCRTLLARGEGRISLFYPSTSFIDTRPAKMTEYAMAKAAAEIMCADLVRRHRRLSILVKRVPRLRTDQTVSLLASPAADPLEYFKQVVRAVHARRQS